MSTPSNNTINTTTFSSTSTTTNTVIITETTNSNTTRGNTPMFARNARRRRTRNDIPPPITWNEREVRLLIDQRKNRNLEYYQTIGRSRVPFWDSVARRINRSVGSNFTGVQCKRKFENLVMAYRVN